MPDSQMSGFAKAIHRCNVGQLSSIPEYNKDKNNNQSFMFQEDSISLVHLCAITNSLECYIYLTEYKKYPYNPRSSKSLTPLHYAAQIGNVEIFEYILSRISQNKTEFKNFISEEFKKGIQKEQSLFYFLAMGSNLEIYKCLEMYGINLREKTNQRILNFMILKASDNQSHDCLRYLLTLLASTDGTSYSFSSDRPPLIIAASKNLDLEIIKTLSTICSVDEFDKNGKSALFYICEFTKNSEKAKYLLEKMNVIEPKTKSFPSAIHYLFKLCDPGVIEIAFQKFGNEIRLDTMYKDTYATAKLLVVPGKNEADIKRILKVLHEREYDFNKLYTLFDFIGFRKSPEVCRFLIDTCNANPFLKYNGRNENYKGKSFYNLVKDVASFKELCNSIEKRRDEFSN